MVSACEAVDSCSEAVLDESGLNKVDLLGVLEDYWIELREH